MQLVKVFPLRFSTSRNKEVSRKKNLLFLLCSMPIPYVYNSLCLLAIAPPVSPSNIKVDKMGSKMSVSWDPLTPEQAMGFVTSYTITYAKEGGSRKRQILEKVVPGTENSTVIEGLDPNQDYSVSVRADTKAGVGKVSEPASSKGIYEI